MIMLLLMMMFHLIFVVVDVDVDDVVVVVVGGGGGVIFPDVPMRSAAQNSSQLLGKVESPPKTLRKRCDKRFAAWLRARPMLHWRSECSREASRSQ